MFEQSNLFGETLKTPETKQELNSLCCESCYSAKEKICRCKCKGAYHGLGRLNKREQTKQAETYTAQAEDYWKARAFYDKIKVKAE